MSRAALGSLGRARPCGPMGSGHAGVAGAQEGDADWVHMSRVQAPGGVSSHHIQLVAAYTSWELARVCVWVGCRGERDIA